MEALLITDGDCDFCQRSAAKLKRISPTGWLNVPSSLLTENYGLTSAQLAHSVWLSESTNDGVVKYSGAKAVGKVLRMRGGVWAGIGWLTFIPPASWIADDLYQFVAGHRKFFSRYI
ncbi:MAG: DCC1-like thiol-disulfide oxidoreductase family protein [Actinomycetes bacterium]